MKENITVKLIANGGSLYTPFESIVDDALRHYYDGNRQDKNPILLFEHSGGDHDTIAWPRPNQKHLKGALFDAREMGLIPDVKTVLLPDGKEFQID